MLFLKRSQPAPECLDHEKKKASGDYKCGDVLTRLKDDFKNKCYICECDKPKSINVEHLVSHKGNNDLKFSWENLFWSCAHCNNIKSTAFDDILNCTDPDDLVEEKLKYIFKPFPYENVEIELLDNSANTKKTKELLLNVYNGTTPLKKIESANLRDSLLDEIKQFQEALINYFKKTNDDDDKEYFRIQVKGHLSSASNFTSFKRWIIRDNDRLLKEFKKYLTAE